MYLMVCLNDETPLFLLFNSYLLDSGSDPGTVSGGQFEWGPRLLKSNASAQWLA